MIERITVIFFLIWIISAYTLRAYAGDESLKLNEVQEEITKTVNDKHLRCIATGIYYESRGETVTGQIAVARVIVNRVLHGFAADPCAVVYQTTKRKTSSGVIKKSCQFSWVCDGKSVPSDDNPRYKKAKEIARRVLSEDKWSDLIPNNTLFFHSTSASPNWGYRKVKTIGNHIFYSTGSEKNIPVIYKDK